MEDMARLALVEESVRDIDKFRKLLYELWRHIDNILENPHDNQLRTFRSNILKEITKYQSFTDYLKYVGFEVMEDNLVYPKQATLSNLRMALTAIERKINFCFGSIDNNLIRSKETSKHRVSKINQIGLKVVTYPYLVTSPFLLKVQHLFNNMLVYEEPELQALARQQMPIVTLQLMALDRVREQQMQIKTGKIKALDLPFDTALLMELLSWFKYKFFSWVDKPPCEECGGETTFVGISSMTDERETCRLELYKCTQCPGRAKFPRYNDVHTLLQTRRGRCGEWANCFTALCRTLGYDVRYVYDTTDHVWCEVFDYDSNTWLHVDPCEGKLNAPLMYSHGWGKKLSYVIAVSRDDLQDVTWRYTVDHKQVLKRRTECSEADLIASIVTLRFLRQRDVSDARRLYLARRNLRELVLLMQERKPSDYESHGRISGSEVWRRERGEEGVGGHTFSLTHTGLFTLRYNSGTDAYSTDSGASLSPGVLSWRAGVFHAKHLQRKVEHDWGKVYLARSEGEECGSISWQLSCAPGLHAARLTVRASCAEFDTGRVEWTVTFDDDEPTVVTLGELPTEFSREFSKATVTCELSGGSGDVAWQHAQLFRQALDDTKPAMEITALVHQL